MNSLPSNKIFKFTSLLIMATLLLSACQNAAPASAIPLEETTWLMQSYRNAQGQTTQALPGSEANARFSKDGKIFGNASCNQYSGAYQISGNRITIDPGAMTMMMCPDEGVSAQEQDFIAALKAAATYKIQGEQLILVDKDGNTVLTFTAQKSDALTSVTWQATAVNNGKQAVVSLLAGSEITANFTSDGKLSGKAGCNNYNTGYKVDGNSIQIEPAATTRMMCSEPQGVMEQEAAYLKALEAAKTFELVGSRLTLFGEDGARLVEYIAK
jgi:heat shock protein HslJ